MEALQKTVLAFFSQPFGAIGAVFIMVAVTVFNSRRLQRKLSKWSRNPASLPNLLNGCNLIGGTCLLVNAWQRDEVVWIVLEIYFVAIAVKGLLQTKPITKANAEVASGH